MKYEKAIEELQTGQDGKSCCDGPSDEALELAADALAFVKSLHQVFKENGMTSKEEPDLAELENLIDAIHGELGAAAIFLAEPVFARVPDMLRVVEKQLEKENDESVPKVISKGYGRLAKRIEVTRMNLQSIVADDTKNAEST